MSHMKPKSTFVSLAVMLAAALACQPSPDGVNVEIAIFPGEGRLGSSATMLVDANYFVWNDLSERYDVEPDRVQVMVDDGASAPVAATVRAVFPFSLARSSVRSKNTVGEWATMVLFDLPTSGLQPTNQATITAKYDGAYLAHGTFRIVGGAGSPWRPPVPGYTPLERTFETRSLLRLRGVRRNPQVGDTPPPPVPDGFLDAWNIGALEVEIQYPLCLKPPKAYSNSEAANATVFLGPGSPPDNGFVATVKVVLVDPQGFSLKGVTDPYGASPDNAGQGPFLDIAFDRYQGGMVCTHLAPSSFWIRKLYVTDKNGVTLIDRRTGDTDSSDLFSVFVLDAEAS